MKDENKSKVQLIGELMDLRAQATEFERMETDLKESEVAKMESISTLLGTDLFNLEELKSSKELRNIEWDVKDKKGNIHSLLINLKSVSIKGGTVLYSCRDITERKQAERALRESDERFRTTAKETGQLLYSFEPKTGKVKWAGAIEAVTGYTYEEYQSFDVNDWAEHIHPDDRERILKAMDQAVKHHTRFDAEYRSRHKDGSYIFVEEHGAFISGGEDTPYSIVGTISDISERKQAEEYLRESEATLRSFFNSISTMVGIVDVFEDDIMNISDNPASGRFWGIDPETMRGKLASEYNTPKDYVRMWIKYYRKAERTRKPVYFEYTHKLKDQTYWLAATVDFINRISDNRMRCCYVIEDITERKQAEEELRESEAKFRTLAETTPACIFIFQGDMIQYVNPAAMQITGYSETELLQMKFWEVVHPAFRDLVRERGRARQKGKPVTKRYAVKVLTKQGQERWVDFIGELITYQGKPATLGTALDFTDRILLEEELRQNKEKLEEAETSAGFGSWQLEVGQETGWWSKNLYKIFGLDPALGTPSIEDYLDFVHPEDRSLVQKTLRGMSEGGEPPTPPTYRSNPEQGPQRYFSSTIHCERDAEGKPVKFIGSIIDITERKKAEEALKDALAEVEILKNRLEVENIYLQDEIKVVHNFGTIIGKSKALKHVLNQAETVAATDSNVLLLGETGTGKELIARAIHDLSKRSTRALVKVNCAVLPANLIESELFGHEKGAFTGAHVRRIGRFELAHEGTIFLDEIGDLPLDLQVKLLRVLQDGELERLGSHETINVDIRAIAATNRNLDKLVQEGAFREDLFFRLDVFPIHLPPLHERKDDIPILVKHFIEKYSTKLGKDVTAVPAKTMRILQAYDWPGNVRELENVIERAMVISPTNKLKLGDWFMEAMEGTPKPLRLQDLERKHITEMLKQTNWRVSGVSGAARILGLKPTTLEARMKKLGIQRPK